MPPEDTVLDACKLFAVVALPIRLLEMTGFVPAET